MNVAQLRARREGTSMMSLLKTRGSGVGAAATHADLPSGERGVPTGESPKFDCFTNSRIIGQNYKRLQSKRLQFSSGPER